MFEKLKKIFKKEKSPYYDKGISAKEGFKKVRYVISHSQKYNYYLELNNNYKFLLDNEIYKVYAVPDICLYDIEINFRIYVKKYLRKMKQIVEEININMNHYSEYQNYLKAQYFDYEIDENIISLKEFKEIEDIECEKLIIYFYPQIKYIISNSYFHYFSFDFLLETIQEIEGGDELKEYIDKNNKKYKEKYLKNKKQEELETEKNKEYRKKAIPLGLRYDVLHRDGYKCVICGKNVKDDNIRLHIGYIVSKTEGGKENIDNLRTLCENCDLNKINKQERQYVKNTSEKYQYYLKTKQKYNNINKIEDYTFIEKFENKRDFDFCVRNFKTSFYIFIYENIEKAKELKEIIEKQKIKYANYLEDIKNYPDLIYDIDLDIISLEEYKKIEDLYCYDLFLPFKFQINYSARYITPKGRFTYNTLYCFSIEEFWEIFNEIETDINKGNILKYERKNKNKLSKLKEKKFFEMTAKREPISSSLKNEVLHRDKYRCVICGNNVNNGAKLHVDHIVPVSRGGTNDINNLRTLCEDCNLGRSNKYLD